MCAFSTCLHYSRYRRDTRLLQLTLIHKQLGLGGGAIGLAWDLDLERSGFFFWGNHKRGFGKGFGEGTSPATTAADFPSAAFPTAFPTTSHPSFRIGFGSPLYLLAGRREGLEVGKSLPPSVSSPNLGTRSGSSKACSSQQLYKQSNPIEQPSTYLPTQPVGSASSHMERFLIMLFPDRRKICVAIALTKEQDNNKELFPLPVLDI